jgi:YD repeat-containing protein
MTAVQENGATSGVGVLATFAYDNLGRRTSLTRGNGGVTSYGFDAASRLSSLTQNPARTADDLAKGFAYNPFGGKTIHWIVF